MGAAAHGYDVRIAHEDLHLLYGHAHHVGGHLGEAGLMALPTGLGADDDLHGPIGFHHDFRALLGRADGGFHIVGEAHAQQLAARFRLGAAGLLVGPSRDDHGAIHVGLVGPAVIDRARAIAVGHGFGGDEVLAAQLDLVHAESFGRDFDQPLHGVVDLGTARAAIGLGRHGVRKHRPRPQGGGGDVIGAGDEARALAQRREGHGAGAHIAEIVGAEAQKLSILVHGQRHFRAQIAALIIAEESLRAGGGVAHGAAQFAGGPEHEAEFHEDAVARAEVAAHVIGEHAQIGGLDAQHMGELGLLAHGAAAARVKRVAASRLVEIRHRRARLQRYAGDAGDVEVIFHDVPGLGEGCGGRLFVAEEGLHADIVGQFIPDRDGAGAGGLAAVGDEGQDLVVDLQGLGGVLRLRLRLRHHHGDGLAHMAGAVGGQQHVRADEDIASAAGRGELHVEFGLGQGIVGDGLQPIVDEILSRKHAEHAGHGKHAVLVDRKNSRMGMGRARHGGIGLPIKAEIIGETALAGDQASILLAADGLADGLEQYLCDGSHGCVSADEASPGGGEAASLCLR